MNMADCLEEVGDMLKIEIGNRLLKMSLICATNWYTWRLGLSLRRFLHVLSVFIFMVYCW